MKTKFYFESLLVICLFFSTSVLQAQSAKSVVDKMINVFQTNSIQTNFGLVVKESNSTDLHKVGGTFLMKDNKFMLTTNDMQVYFDGTTQWAYMPEINEVSITTPTEKELAATNPMTLLHAYRDKSTMRFINNSGNKNTYIVELKPKDAKSDMKRIQVTVNKTNYYPLSIQLEDQKGMISTLALTKFLTGVKTTDKTFTFDASIYKDIEINDLR